MLKYKRKKAVDIRKKKYLYTWYGNSEDFGIVFSTIKTKLTPNLHFGKKEYNKYAYTGFDYERYRFVVERYKSGRCKKPRKWGWRKRVYYS